MIHHGACEERPDTVVIDLEDAVIDKEAGRKTTCDFLTANWDTIKQTLGDSVEIIVRINPLESGDVWVKDLEAVIAASQGNVKGFMLPKVNTPADV